MKNPAIAIIILGLAACTTVDQSTRVATDLHAKQFNDVASQYLDRPTFASIEKMSDGTMLLFVRMDEYNTTESERVLGGPGLSFNKKDVPQYVAAIDKFLSWAALATERKDMFTKDIAEVPTWGDGERMLS